MALWKNISVQHPISCCAMAARLQNAVATASLVYLRERMLRSMLRPSVVLVMSNSASERIPQDSIRGRQSLKSLGITFRRQSTGIDKACCSRFWRAVSLQTHITEARKRTEKTTLGGEAAAIHKSDVATLVLLRQNQIFSRYTYSYQTSYFNSRNMTASPQ